MSDLRLVKGLTLAIRSLGEGFVNIICLAAAGTVFICLLWVAEFFIIVDTSAAPKLSVSEGIAVFSGDPSRVRRGFELLSQGWGRQLIIAGQDNASEVRAEQKRYPTLSGCCLAIEQSSRNTHQDAAEIACWVKARGFRTLIVVTSVAHAPRAYQELRQVLIDVEFLLVGVPSNIDATHDWKVSPPVWRGILREVAKYLYVRSNLADWSAYGCHNAFSAGL